MARSEPEEVEAVLASLEVNDPGLVGVQTQPEPFQDRSIRSKVRELTSPRNTYADIAHVVGRLNRRLQGWANYFRRGNSAKKFSHVDTYAHERLMIWMSHKHGLQRRRNWRRFDHEWLHRIGVYRLALVKLQPYPAHARR
jgi:hypothetical protein